jgi:hypothetical protein
MKAANLTGGLLKNDDSKKESEDAELKKEAELKR